MLDKSTNINDAGRKAFHLFGWGDESKEYIVLDNNWYFETTITRNYYQMGREFVYDGYRYKLENDIDLKIDIDDDLYVSFYAPLKIHLYGHTIGELVRSFKEEVSFLWHEYAMANNRNLSAGAIKIKKRVRELVKAKKIERA